MAFGCPSSCPIAIRSTQRCPPTRPRGYKKGSKPASSHHQPVQIFLCYRCASFCSSSRLISLVDLTQSATMKVIIAAFVVIALAQGSLAVDATEMEMIGQKFEEIKNKMTEELSKMINTQELGSQAQAFLEQQRNQFEPMMTKVQEQMKAAAASMQEQLEPMTTNFQAQMQPMVLKFQEQMEAILRQLTEQAKAMTN
uniref:Type-4 ice-structuring protein LS-12-like n=1 Tax=Hippocampus comes TaxID=109280 RepID=A0A3Q3D3X8_HIPCM